MLKPWKQKPPRTPEARLLASQVRSLSPAYFGMVMATGIVSLAANQVGLGAVAWALFAIACVAYLVLWGLTILRIIRHPRAVFADLIDHLRGPGFFTMVAASGVLGSEFVIMAGAITLGLALWLFAVLLWLGLLH